MVGCCDAPDEIEREKKLCEKREKNVSSKLISV